MQFVEHARLGARVYHGPDHGEEQRANHAVGEHLQHRAGQADLVECGQAKQYEAHVANTRVADDVLEVVLFQSDKGAVNDVDDGDDGDARCPRLRPLRQQPDRHAKAAVRPEFHHHAGQQHGGGGRRGDMTGRCPGVERPHAGQDGKADEEQGKDPVLRRGGDLSLLQCKQAERLDSLAIGILGQEIQRDHSKQHQSATTEGVQHQLHRRELPTDSAPDGDQEILGHHRDLVKDEQQKQVERKEHAVHAAD